MDAETALEGTAPFDYRLVCRTCLASDAEFYKLDSPIFVENQDSDEKPASFMDCLRYCTRFSDYDDSEKLQYPIYICTECSAALQVSYSFIKNALEAHEILRQKLSEYTDIQPKNLKILRKNGLVEEIGRGCAGTQDGVDTDVPKMRFRCKICNEKVETKRALKEHIKLHLDIISYCCQLCNFECKKRTLLFDHYKLAHHTQPTKEQLKPKTMQPNQAPIKREEEIDFEDSIAKEMEKIHNNQVNAEYLHDTQNEIQNQQQPQDINMKLFLTPTSSNASAAAAYVEAATAATATDGSTETITVKTEHSASISTNLQQYGTEEFNIAANELSVGNEFIVMADGTVEEVMGNGVVIEYINAADDGVTLENGLVMDNIMQVQQTGDMDQTVTMDMDVDDMIIEECIGSEITAHNMSSITMAPETTVQTLQNIEDELPPPAIISAANVLTAKRIKCKICASNFQTQDQLKTHMLTHNEIPHFFCDQCAFYTFFKIDLTQHYKTKHKLQPTQKQLQPKNKVKSHDQPGDMKHVYACDLCLFETRIKAHLRRHYLSQHQEEATEVQLRPTIDESVALTQPEVTPSDSPPKQRGKVLRPDYPKGLNCKKCSKIFYWREKLKDHYRQHGLEESNGIDVAVNDTMVSDIVVDNAAPGTSLLKQNTFQYQLPPAHDGNNVNIMLNTNIGHNHYNSNAATADPSVIDAQAIVDAAVAEAQAAGMQLNMQMNAPAPDIIMDIPVATTITNTAVAIDTTVGVNHVHDIQHQQQQQQHLQQHQQQQHHHQSVAVMAGYACQQIPSDAIPQVVETETTIDNSELDFVFNDALFEEFEEDENEDEENEEDAGTDFQDLLLTSDDDFDDMLEDEQQKQREFDGEIPATPNTSTYQPYCVHCNRKFFSQYHFENHMFVHRGLAPYRCEMCTNLYNTKRALIRHYRAVHKKIPTRDMIQAKGDKVVVDHTPIAHLNLIEKKAVTLMCAKCPFESVDLTVMQIHLNTMHGLVDENFILQKLPFECPRCIRSCATRARLIRHLERSHSVATIIQQHRITNNLMRNQLQQQQTAQQQQQLENQPFIAIKDTATATTTTIAAATTHPSASTIAVTTFSPAAPTSSSCGQGINMQSYQFNYNNKNNNDEDDDDDDDDDDDADADVDADADADTDVDNAVGVDVVGGDAACIQDVNINNNNNNTLDNHMQHTVAAAIEISPLSKLIADMEHDEQSQADDSIVATTMFTHTSANTLLRKKVQCSKMPPAITAANMPRIRRKSMSNVVNTLITANTYNQLNENNELFDEYACGMCSQSWRTAAELHAHECIRLAGSLGSGNKEALEEYATTTSAEEKCSNRKGLENVGLITSERSLYLFKCDICHCNYKSSELLKHHMKRHTARIFRCSHCPKTYINRSELKFHQLSHTGEKPHKCKMCPKQFRYPHHLKRHCDVVHLGKRARCPVVGCGRTFTTQAQLKIHGWIHDGNEPYRCKYCRQSFKKRESLRKHTRRVHHFDLTEQEIADIYRQNVGHTNPHDFTVSLSNGRMLRRSDFEQVAEHQHALDDDLPTVSVSASEAATVGEVVKTEIDIDSSLSPLLASNSHKNIHIQQLVLGVEEEDETAVSHISQTSNSMSTHEETIHTYMLPGMEEHGQLPHFKLENSGSF
ncbi:uncharacterized protein LOC101453298 isoform X1 [Ceratitis capitata]|uniref:uncharacterized protein LOC101453298 isoform X1 n=1 Tax=Ceratitis capitata TaxID=7213 RepID=UPI000A0F70DB|nr:uncharacterized protein LOC101453298 isoform X1 [Ceratitis capitata]